MINKQRSDVAARVAEDIKQRIQKEQRLIEPVRPEIGIILGTGWGSSLHFDDCVGIDLRSIKDFMLVRRLEGHTRSLLYGKIADRNVLALSGRLHMNEDPTDKNWPNLVRLQVELMCAMGVRKFIFTNAAGGLKERALVGQVLIVDGFISLLSMSQMPLFAGEFCSPEVVLFPEYQNIARQAARDTGITDRTGGLAFFTGPNFEGRKYDKKILYGFGASAVGMSVLPETAVASLYPDAKVLAVSYITNGDTEAHSHEANLAQAATASSNLGLFLSTIVERLP